jgi:hypothetical protein
MLKITNITSVILYMEKFMTQGQRTIWFQLFAEIIILIYFGRKFLAGHAAGRFEGPDGMVALGQFFLWVILAAIVVSIAVHVIGMILVGIANRGELPDDTTDERDRLIELRGDRVSHWVTGGGFLAAMILLATGTSVPYVLGTLFLGCFIGDIVGNVLKLVAYGRG